MRKILALGLALACLASASANAAMYNNDEHLRIATADKIGNILPDSITLSDVKRHMTSVSWKAQTPSGTYTCEADDMLRHVACAQDKKQEDAKL